MKRSATSVWTGSGKDGHGELTTPSGTLSSTRYSFTNRFEKTEGTSPEELLAAAHAGCFNMAFAFGLGEAGFTPDGLTTTSTVTVDKPVGGDFTITKVDVEVNASIPDATQEQFQQLADAAGKNCPVSRLFKAEINVKAKLN